MFNILENLTSNQVRITITIGHGAMQISWCMNMIMFCLCLSYIAIHLHKTANSLFYYIVERFLYVQSQSVATVQWNRAFGNSKVGLGPYSLTRLDPGLLLHLERREIYWEGYSSYKHP